MPLLIISPYFFQETAARAIQVRKLYEGLSGTTLKFYLATHMQFHHDKEKHFEKIIELSNANYWYDKPFDGPLKQNLSLLAKFIEEKNITTLLTVSTPIYSSFLGLFLKQHFKNLNLICYFSDPVPTSILPAPYFKGYPSNFYRIKSEIQKSEINQVLYIADKIIVPSINTINYFEKNFSVALKFKTSIIPHIGGQLPNIKKSKPLKKDLKKRLVYFGDMYNRHSIDLIEACKMARKDFPEKFHGLTCYGTNNMIGFKNFLKQFHAEDIIEIRPFINYQKSLELMSQSEVLLLIEANMKESPFMPSKYFDYLFSNRPILAISPLKNSLNEFYSNKNDLIVVKHGTKDIYNAIKTVFHQGNRRIKRDLAHLKSEIIINQYNELIHGVSNNSSYSDNNLSK